MRSDLSEVVPRDLFGVKRQSEISVRVPSYQANEAEWFGFLGEWNLVQKDSVGMDAHSE